MVEIKSMLMNMPRDLKQHKQDMVDMKEDIKNTIHNNINEKFQSLELKNEFLETKLEEQNKQIFILERHITRKNLVLFGVEDKEKSYEELENTIITIINTYFKVPCDNSNIEAVRRVGKKGEKPRPVIITFTTMGLKIKVEINKKSLQNTQYYIKEDYPIQVLNKRRELQVQLQIEKQAANTSFIKYNKLIVLQNNKKSTSNQVNKRNLSESPEITSPSGLPVSSDTRQPPKKNKVSNMKEYITQKPKLVLTQTDTSNKYSKITSHSNNV